MDYEWLARSSLLLRMLQALQVRSSQVLAVAVSVMGFDYSHGRRPPSDPQCIPRRVFKESHGLRVAVLCPERHPAPSLRRRPVPSLSEHRGLPLARGSVVRVDLFDTTRPTLQNDSSQPSFAATIRGTPS